jgi:hypothetical protein
MSSTFLLKTGLFYLVCSLVALASLHTKQQVFLVAAASVVGIVPILITAAVSGFDGLSSFALLIPSLLFGLGLGWIVQQVDDVTNVARIRFLVLLGIANSAPALCLLLIFLSYPGS